MSVRAGFLENKNQIMWWIIISGTIVALGVAFVLRKTIFEKLSIGTREGVLKVLIVVAIVLGITHAIDLTMSIISRGEVVNATGLLVYVFVIAGAWHSLRHLRKKKIQTA